MFVISSQSKRKLESKWKNTIVNIYANDDRLSKPPSRLLMSLRSVNLDISGFRLVPAHVFYMNPLLEALRAVHCNLLTIHGVPVVSECKMKQKRDDIKLLSHSQSFCFLLQSESF